MISKAMATACAAVLLALSGAQVQQARAGNAREDTSPQRQEQNRKDDPQQRNDATRQEPPAPSQPGGVDPQVARPHPDENGPNAAYMAELRKCNRMSGDLRNQCVAEAKQRYGQM